MGGVDVRGGKRVLPQDVGALDGGPAAATKPRPEFRTSETQLRFLTPDVAVEDGTVDVVLPGMTTSIEGWFSALWVRTGGGWKLAGLRESERPITPAADMLADLEWMVGDWTLVVEEPAGQPGTGKPASPAATGMEMEMSVRWDAGKAFLIRDIRVPDAAADDAAAGVEVHQRIGWDPTVRRIRSWSFSSDGSRGEATWYRDGDSWVVEQAAITPDGRQDSAINIFSYDGRDRCVWRILSEALDSDAGRPTRATWVRKANGGNQ